jgi:hypothetical protein
VCDPCSHLMKNLCASEIDSMNKPNQRKYNPRLWDDEIDG